MSKSLIKLVFALIAGVTVCNVSVILPAKAGQFRDGQTFFERPPSLVRTTTTNPATGFSSTYEFTLTVPVDAGAPLQAVTISQPDVAEIVAFDIGKSLAFASDRYGVGTRLPLASTGGIESENDKQTTIVFDPPVQPGTTVTIALKVKQNPSMGGTYLFGVTAYPTGDNPIGLFLGQGRLTFYNQQG